MRDLDKETSELLQSTEEKLFHFTQAGSVNDPSLNQLRDQIKKVMIPLLIKIFQLKLELNQTISFPSRLQTQKNQRSLDEIIEQLKQLDKDLKVLHLWCHSCRSQIQKAMSPPEEEPKSAITSATDSNPAVSKSFSDALSAQNSRISNSIFTSNASVSEEPPAHSPQKNSWWKKILRKRDK